MYIHTHKFTDFWESLPEAEYVVTCVKHMFAKHIVFQFNIKNTMEEEQLENVMVNMDCDSKCQIQSSVPAQVIK